MFNMVLRRRLRGYDSMIVGKVTELCDHARKIFGPSSGEKAFQEVLKAYLEDQFYIVNMR